MVSKWNKNQEQAKDGPENRPDYRHPSRLDLPVSVSQSLLQRNNLRLIHGVSLAIAESPPLMIEANQNPRAASGSFSKTSQPKAKKTTDRQKKAYFMMVSNKKPGNLPGGGLSCEFFPVWSSPKIFLGNAFVALGGQFRPGLIVPEAGKLSLDCVGPFGLRFVLVVKNGLDGEITAEIMGVGFNAKANPSGQGIWKSPAKLIDESPTLCPHSGHIVRIPVYLGAWFIDWGW